MPSKIYCEIPIVCIFCSRVCGGIVSLANGNIKTRNCKKCQHIQECPLHSNLVELNPEVIPTCVCDECRWRYLSPLKEKASWREGMDDSVSSNAEE